MAERPFHHLSVLLDAVLQQLAVRPGGRYLDGTLGGGGHTAAILDASGPDGSVLGLDQDLDAIDAATARNAAFGERFEARHGRFGDMARLAADRAPFDGILLDIGVSSPQLDRPDRGFSLQADGPLDMRMDRSTGETASALLDRIDLDGLVRILREYGEEPRARRIARAILAGRPWTSTLALADAVARASGYRNSRIHPATRSFQALRIAVNDELGELERALDAAPALLGPGGRLAVITFHSLEDRIVKHRFRTLAGVGAPRDAFGNPMTPPGFRLVTRRGIAGRDADPTNPRARSARLRVIERTAVDVTAADVTAANFAAPDD